MNLYSIHIQNTGGAPVAATITFLDSSFNPIVSGGVTAQTTTDANGFLEYQANANSINVRVSAAGYSDRTQQLVPGNNTVTLNTGVQGPEVIIGSCRQYYTVQNGACRFSIVEWIKGNILLSLIALIIILIGISKLKK